ncbi:lipopolysaccharide transport periplasmic protein LptA [Salmonella enterica subsp. enterica]|uniref:Lipopolysaccharide transport periplasmic protein LptA n=1 Tax=Salmonella enterica I TaxID=59201 RepID=A0A379VL86_SALET|nr:lipopolysaccharide transport periplasmic protein LptA [Salmonella enterica subsp. enterica]
MKFKTNKLSLNLMLAGSLLAASIPAFAVTGDTEQPIHIDSDQQSLGYARQRRDLYGQRGDDPGHD